MLCFFHSVSTCRQIWWALDSLHGREYEWHSHAFARESSAIWEITLKPVIIGAKAAAAAAHMHMHKTRHQNAELCPATNIMQCLEAENVFLLGLRELWVSHQTNSHKISTDVSTHQQMPHLTCFGSLTTLLAVLNITSQQQWRPYPLLCLRWSLLCVYEGLWKCSRSSLLIIDFLSKMYTRDVCQHWGGASQSNIDTSGQKTPRLKHGPTPVLSHRLSSIHFCGRGNILNSQMDRTVVFTHYTVQYHILKCVSNGKCVTFLAYVPVFILKSTSFWSAATGYDFLQKRRLDMSEN